MHVFTKPPTLVSTLVLLASLLALALTATHVGAEAVTVSASDNQTLLNVTLAFNPTYHTAVRNATDATVAVQAEAVYGVSERPANASAGSATYGPVLVVEERGTGRSPGSGSLGPLLVETCYQRVYKSFLAVVAELEGNSTGRVGAQIVAGEYVLGLGPSLRAPCTVVELSSGQVRVVCQLTPGLLNETREITIDVVNFTASWASVRLVVNDTGVLSILAEYADNVPWDAGWASVETTGNPSLAGGLTYPLLTEIGGIGAGTVTELTFIYVNVSAVTDDPLGYYSYVMVPCGQLPPWAATTTTTTSGGGGLTWSPPPFSLPTVAPPQLVFRPPSPRTPAGLLVYLLMVALYVTLSDMLGWRNALVVFGVIVALYGVVAGDPYGAMLGGGLAIAAGFLLKQFRR